MDLLRGVVDPELGADVVDLGTARGVRDVRIDWTEMTAEQKAHAMGRARWNARESAPPTAVPLNTRVLAISSGKGGVGKSSVAVNLAAALAAEGRAVGVLDADIGGFSVPRMLGLEGRLAGAPGERKIVPHTKVVGAGRIEVVSMGLLAEGEAPPLVGGGPMQNRAPPPPRGGGRGGDPGDPLIHTPPGPGGG